MIAGGATGGHLFPGIAIAESLSEQVPDSTVMFVSTGTDLERGVLPKTGFAFEIIPTEGIKGRGPGATARAVAKLVRGVGRAMLLIRRYRPDIIIGMGGYSSAPMIFGGRLMRVRIALHEQNALPGVSNRLLARFADRVFIALPPAAEQFPADKVILTGNPVRRDIQAAAAGIGSARPDSGGRFTVLILGGSQGAGGINRAVTAALAHLEDKDRYYFVHQTGAADEKTVRDAYRHHGVDARVQPFFEDMAEQYAGADFLICRAGATTVAEITSLGKVALLVPFPYAADDHQTRNAEALTAVAGAEMIQERELTGPLVADKIAWYADHPEKLADMAARARSLGHPGAGRRVVEECLALVAGGRKKQAVM